MITVAGFIQNTRIPIHFNDSKSGKPLFVTVFLANSLKETNIKVNAVNPGWVQTSIGSDQAPLTPADGAKSGVEMALIDGNSPTGTFSQSGDSYLGRLDKFE